MVQGLCDRLDGALEELGWNAVWPRCATVLKLAYGSVNLIEGGRVDRRVRIRYCARREVLKVGARGRSGMVQC